MKLISNIPLKFFVGACCIFFAAFLNFNCGSEKTKVAEIPSQVYASLNDSNSYVGMNTCKECHQSIYDSFIETGMGKSFDHASKLKSSAKFGAHEVIYDKFRDFYYHPFWEGDSMRIMEFRLEGRDTIYKRIETVSYIVGSGQHTNSHIMNTGGFLNQMPMTFYTQKGHWDLPPGFENGGNTRFNRLIGLECMSCHNSYPVFVKGSENKFSFVDRGIGCERCHGPGEQHVNDKKSGKIVDVVTGIDYSIVNPAKLKVNLQFDICQRCHVQGNAVLNEGKSFFDFRPGMELSSVMNVFMPVFKGRENEHIMASHAERLKLSRCYLETTRKIESDSSQSAHSLTPYKNALTCVTCHNPHISVKVTGADTYNKACRNCHQESSDHSCKADVTKLKSMNFDCVKCHMPQSGATDIPHVSVHDHKIGIPVDDKQIEKIKVFAGINCINNPHPPADAKGRAFISYFEKFNYGTEVLDSARKYFPDNSKENIRKYFRELIHISFLEKNYAKVIAYTDNAGDVNSLINKMSYDNQDAWTSYRIGESYFNMQNIQGALKYYEQAYKLAPMNNEFANKYAALLMQVNKTPEGIKILEKSIADYPKYAPALSNLGYMYLLQNGDTAKARLYYDRALALDPDYTQVLINKAGLSLIKGNKKDARLLIQRILKRDPSNTKAQELIKELGSL